MVSLKLIDIDASVYNLPVLHSFNFIGRIWYLDYILSTSCSSILLNSWLTFMLNGHEIGMTRETPTKVRMGFT
ncbi:hypothetical protein ACE6H2_026324 [Prunus campanulata]